MWLSKTLAEILRYAITKANAKTGNEYLVVWTVYRNTNTRDGDAELYKDIIDGITLDERYALRVDSDEAEDAE